VFFSEHWVASCRSCSNKETGRDIYVEDELLMKVYEHAEQPLRDALDCFISVADTLKMDERDVRSDQLWVQQRKTGAKRRVEIVGELKVVIDRIMKRKAGY
jgi:hypothetical protein